MYICISVSQGMAGNCHCFGVRLQVGQGGEFEGIQLYLKTRYLETSRPTPVLIFLCYKTVKEC